MFLKIETAFRVTVPILLVSAAACGSSGGSASQPVVSSDDYTDGGTGDGGAESIYERTALTSDVQTDGGAEVDKNLVNPWGIAHGPDTAFWIANNGTGTSTVYDKDGKAQDLVVKLPSKDNESAKPTGLVYHAGRGFEIGSGDRRAPARFIFATEQGTILGWNADSNETEAILAVDRSRDDAIYKGLAIATDKDVTRLYATNFHSGRVDVFDSDFKLAKLSNDAFVDPDLPEGYAPFGIQAIDKKIYVTFAEQDDKKEDDVAGKGKGYVSVFELDGTFLDRVAEKGALDAPWAITRAPKDFGKFGDALLVGNFGDGHINAFDAKTHDHLGQLKDDAGKPIAIDGLWGLIVGNGKDAGDTDTLYYTAGPDDEKRGVFGRLRPKK